MLYNVLNHLFKILDQLKIEQDILQVISMAFLTILIPVAIAIFGDKKEFEVLDRNVILDHVVEAKFFLFYLGLIFLPLLFWNISSAWLRFVEIILWAVGIYFMSNILINSYRWMKGNKFRLRFDYLNNLKDIKAMKESWHSVWEAEKINPQNERQFFEIFSSIIEQLLKNNEQNLKTISKLIGDFDLFINNRSMIFLVLQNGAFPKILEWHFKIWEKEYKYIAKEDKLDEGGGYGEISLILDSILKKIEERALKERAGFLFFKTFKKHAETHKWRFVESEDKSKKYYYCEYLFEIFYRVFFEIIANSSENYNIWNHYFPSEWKITKNNLVNKENVISRNSWNNFLIWARERIRQTKEDYDRKLDDVSYNLFPNVDPILWAIILIFVFSSYGENRVKSVVEKRWNFGHFGRIRTFSENPKDAEKIEANHTFELAYLLFPSEFTKENLKQYINNLKELKYDVKSEEEYKRLKLLDLFEKMLKYKSN